MEQIKAPSKISPPTPLWFAWSSELETVSSSAFPSAADLSRCPHQQVIDRLGLHATYMLAFEQADTLESTQGCCVSPIFFLGLCYSHRDPEKHDTTAPHKQPVWDVIMSKRAKLPDKDMQILLDNLHHAKQFWTTADTENDGFKDLLESATNFYGAPESVVPYTDVETLNEVLGDVCELLECVLSEERCLGVQKQK